MTYIIVKDNRPRSKTDIERIAKLLLELEKLDSMEGLI